jgi:hypothetical protein
MLEVLVLVAVQQDRAMTVEVDLHIIQVVAVVLERAVGRVNTVAVV